MTSARDRSLVGNRLAGGGGWCGLGGGLVGGGPHFGRGGGGGGGGLGSKNCGEICQWRAARIFTRAWVLREQGSRAMRRARRTGTLEISRRLRTRSLEAM